MDGDERAAALAQGPTERGPSAREPVKGGLRVWHKLALILLLVGCGPLAAAAYMIADGDATRLA